jgi:hypothetical protein
LFFAIIFVMSLNNPQPKVERQLMKQPHLKGALPREAVDFAWALIASGLPTGTFSNLTYDASDYQLKFALVLGAMARVNALEVGLKGHRFTPIALGWKMKPAQAKYYDLSFTEQFGVEIGNFPGRADYITQVQPALEATTVSILEVNRADSANKIVRELYDYKPSESRDGVLEYSMSNRIGLGLAHAYDVVEKLALIPRASVQAMTPICGPKAVGRSMFTLVHYRAFAKERDKKDMIGTDAIGLLESRVIDSGKNGMRETVSLDFHSNLEHPLGEGSLLVSANTPWFEKPGPHTD